MIRFWLSTGKRKGSVLIAFACIAILLTDCKKEKGEVDYNGYPQEIGKIMVNNCAVSGCHNSSSKEACVGLDLSSWNKMFEGGRNNSSVIPFRPDQSFLLYSINTFDDLGPKLSPTMPVNKAHLSRADVEAVRNWIGAGAPDKNRYVKWSENPNREKIYVVNQGCDLLTVFDAKSKLIMRCVDVGNSTNTESPHDMYVSPDGKYLYISFYANSIFQKYRTSDDTKVGELDLITDSWHSMSISGDSKYALVSHLDADGKVALIDLATMTVKVIYQGSQLFVYPHGNAINYDGTLAYITSQQGNFIYKVNMTDPMNPDIQKVSLNPGEVPNITGSYKPYSVAFSPDYSKYYVTCQGTNELRIFQAANDSLLQVIHTSGVPQIMSFSNTKPYVYVPCMYDTTNASSQSSVNVVNLNTNQLIASINTGNQPRSCVVDDANNVVWVANRNISGTGWAPHHTTACQGRNGYVTIIDQNTLQLIPNWRCEVSVDPYHVTIKK
jgi:DNA-binding beta-propeller fold protein YncE